MFDNGLGKEQTHVEVIWGTPILDEGFTPIPNLVIRYASELMTPKEFQFICVLATFKHDSRDPHPSLLYTQTPGPSSPRFPFLPGQGPFF